MSKNILIGIILFLVLAGILYFIFVAPKETVPRIPSQEPPTPLEKEQGLGGELYEKTGNPAQNVPETNPFKEVETNPLQKTNPFEGGYRNPFE